MPPEKFGSDWEVDAEEGWEEVMGGGGSKRGVDISFEDIDGVDEPTDSGARRNKGKMVGKGSRIATWSGRVVKVVVKD